MNDIIRSRYAKAETDTNRHNTHRFFWYICSNASAMSNALISSLSWNLRDSFPPWPVMYTKMLERTSVRRRFERGTEAYTLPVGR